jgi:RNA-dependent RNA polymerase
MLGGGDLDGDIYNLILDERLHPTIQFEPGAYTQPKLVTLSRPSTAQDIADFVVNYIKVDITPIVCTRLKISSERHARCYCHTITANR